MKNHEWENMNDTDFDKMLTSSISQVPPEHIVAEVNPWNLCINRVLIGMALTTFTLNFLLLDYILPAIGVMLLLLGFRTLRNENNWFQWCFVISVVRTAYVFGTLLLNTTIMRQTVYSSLLGVVLIVTNIVLTFVQFVCLRRGFLSVQQKAGIPPRARGAAALIVWYILANLLALVQYSGWIIGILMIIIYICGIRSLYKLSKEFAEAGYVIQTAPIKITDRCIVISSIVFLLLGSVCGYVFGSSYPMEWSVLDSEEHQVVEDIKTDLVSLGFPKEVLDDLCAEDIESCEGALQVVVRVTERVNVDERLMYFEELEYRNGVRYEVRGDRPISYVLQEQAKDKKLEMIHVGVEVSGERERWIIFHHFRWLEEPDFYGTEALQLWPAYYVSKDAYMSAGDITGRVLCDDGDKTFAADYYSLESQTYNSNVVLLGEQTDIYATFSMSHEGENYRGYVAYPMEEFGEGWRITSWCNYIHQTGWLQYPVRTAMEQRMLNGFGAENFAITYETFQFRPQRNELGE